MKKLIVVLFVMISSQNIFAQSGWQWVNPFPTGNNLQDIKFANPRIGYAVGKSNTVIKTTDGGANWKIMNTGIYYADVKCISVIDSNIIIISGGNESIIYGGGLYIFKTLNGGDNWIYSGHNSGLWSTYFVNTNIGFGINYLNRSVLKTNDGGVNWFTSYTFQTGPSEVFFLNSQTGFATASGSGTTMVRTTDQGNTWSECFSGYSMCNFSFLNNTTGYAIGSEKLIKTTNAGINWTMTGSNPTEIGYPTIKFIGSVGIRGEAYNYSNKIYRTINEGATWDAKITPIGIRDFGFTSQNRGFAVGLGGVILETLDTGKSWFERSFLFNNKGPLFCVDFPDQNVGYVGGDSGSVLKTTNQGLNWNLILLGTGAIKSTFFLNTQTGYVGGKERRLYKTTNEGLTWDMNNYLFPDEISCIYFNNINTGFLTLSSYANGYVYKSTDAGNNWIQQLHLGYNTGSLHFINSNIGYFRAFRETSSGGYSRIYKTINGGNTWDSIYSTLVRITSVKFSSESTGYINVFDQGIYRTTNGGIDWSLVLSNRNLSEIKLIGNNTVYSANYKSTNQGLNWYSYDTRTKNINSVLFINENTGFIVGGLYTPYILKTTDGGTLTSVNYESTLNQIPEDFLLHQNYPNPFNPSTKINYELKLSGFVSLKVFDLLGKEVASLVNEKQNAGIYAVDFNSAEFNLPSGIYFYTLSAGEFKETKKMVLVK